MDKNLKLAIIEAISVIANSTENEVSHKVEHIVDKQPFKKQAIKKTFIVIEISEII